METTTMDVFFYGSKEKYVLWMDFYGFSLFYFTLFICLVVLGLLGFFQRLVSRERNNFFPSCYWEYESFLLITTFDFIIGNMNVFMELFMENGDKSLYRYYLNIVFKNGKFSRGLLWKI